MVKLPSDVLVPGDVIYVAPSKDPTQWHLVQMPDVRIVISSTWREDFSLAELQELFSPACQHQIIDVTPILSIGYDQGGRQREIEQFLQHPAWSGSAWLALDDWRSFFDADCSQLLWIDPATGFQP